MQKFNLVLCEKPSQGAAIAAVLGANSKKDGYFEGNGYLVSWCYGHLVGLAPADSYGEKYKKWSRSALPILPDTWKYEADKDKAKQLSVIKGLMNRADVGEIICATDAGREGQLIFQLVYDYCKCNKPVKRLWISSMEESAVKLGFANLKDNAEYDNLYRSALCRSRADYAVGINATRLFSCLYGSTLNVGRVQSPTLALIVNRENAINGFSSEMFYTPKINCGTFSALGEKISDKEKAGEILKAVEGGNALVLSVKKEKKTAAPPKLFDLTSLQWEANKLYGFTAQQTLNYTQSLYEKCIVSYPRSDSRYLTSSMEAGIPSLVRVVSSMFSFSEGREITVNSKAVIKDSAVSDHHSIIPTLEANKADLSALTAGERSVLQLISLRLIQAVSPACCYEAVTAVLECNGYMFTAKGKTITDEGWKAFKLGISNEELGIKETDNSTEESALPKLQEGQVFANVSAIVKEGKTSPPNHFTDGTLLSAMEHAKADIPAEDEGTEIPNSSFLTPNSCGLGTPATRAAIIEKLIKTGFVERDGKKLKPTKKGVNLIAVLPDTIKSPLMTAEWEHKLKLVETGKLSETEFMEGIAEMVKNLVKDHSAPLPKYASVFSSDGNLKINPDEIVGICPRCGNDIVEKQKGFFCLNRGCFFAFWKDNRFFAAKKKELTRDIVSKLLKDGSVFFSDLYSEKTGKTYSAAVLIDDKYGKVGFKLDFNAKGDK